MSAHELLSSPPTAIDVQCGTGNQEKQHSGNILFNQVVSLFIEEYHQATSKRIKMRITKRVLDLLTDSGVRFLKKCPIHKKWYIGSPKVGRDKIGYFLRLHRRPRGTSSKQEGFCAELLKPGTGVSSSTLATSTISSYQTSESLSMIAPPAVVAAATFADEPPSSSRTHPFERQSPLVLYGVVGHGTSNVSHLGENAPLIFEGTVHPNNRPALLSYNILQQQTLQEKATFVHPRHGMTAATAHTSSHSIDSYPNCAVAITTVPTISTTIMEDEDEQCYTSLLATLIAWSPAQRHRSGTPLTSCSSNTMLLLQDDQKEHHQSKEYHSSRCALFPTPTKGDSNNAVAAAAINLSTARTSALLPVQQHKSASLSKLL